MIAIVFVSIIFQIKGVLGFWGFGVLGFWGAGSGRFILSCRTAERIKVCEWLPDDPYPRAVVQVWLDEAGEPVSAAGIEALEDRITGLFERIANARDLPLPSRVRRSATTSTASSIPENDCTRWHLHPDRAGRSLRRAGRAERSRPVDGVERGSGFGRRGDRVSALRRAASSGVQPSFDEDVARCEVLHGVLRWTVVALQHIRFNVSIAVTAQPRSVSHRRRSVRSSMNNRSWISGALSPCASRTYSRPRSR